ncbi:response regulator transcription factor [Paenibacillus pinistramenti]|uniref:response regulator transcription factor n=1 Tax=Paenibacillus pinistramenti TaxID=1768003 RepID=UPI001109FC39|nr:response regulator transcription factor [Paenibacillus pinistramenti]
MANQLVWIEGKDSSYGDSLIKRLERAGYQVCRLAVNDAPEAHAMVLHPDLVLIDIDGRGPEEITGLVHLHRKEENLQYPVIAITKSPSTEELQMAFSAGVNDYLGKDTPIEELTARITNLISLFERLELGDHEYLNYEDLTIELNQRRVFRAGEEIMLTPKEFELLLFLVRRSNQICSREAVLQEVWGYDFAGKTNVVDVYIKHIRAKIDAGRRHKLLHTVRGAGYMLQ